MCLTRRYAMICALTLLCVIAALLTAGAKAETSGVFEYVLLENGDAKITQWNGEDNTELIIPNELDGHPVTRIGASAISEKRLTSVRFPSHSMALERNAFYSSTIESLSLPSDIDYIEMPAFFCCTVYNLEYPSGTDSVTIWPVFSNSHIYNVQLPGSVIEIGLLDDESIRLYEGIYGMLYSVLHIDIPEGVRFLGHGAFAGAEFEKAILPDSIERVVGNPFGGCQLLERIYVTPDHTLLATIDGVLYSKKDKTLISYPQNREGDAYDIPDGIIAVGDYAFYQNLNLRVLTLPESLHTIGEYAFNDCSHLEALPNLDGIEIINKGVFKGCSGLVSADLPKSVRIIGQDAFAGCDSLTSISFPERLEIIGDSAFENCDQLASVDIPGSIKIIDQDAFADCNSLASISFSEGLETIADGAFSFCSYLESIEFPLSVTSMGDNPLEESGIQIIAVSPDHAYLATIDGVLFSKPDRRLICYPQTFEATEYRVPNGIQEIGGRAFSDCDNLSSVVLPESLSRIGDYAFWNCSALNGIDLPEGLTELGTGALQQCPLTSIKLPDSLKHIGGGSFAGCPITDLVIPEGVESIGMQAFEDCSLTSVSLPESVSFIGENAFNNCPDGMVIKVVNGSYAMEYCKQNGLKYTYDEVNDWLNG